MREARKSNLLFTAILIIGSTGLITLFFRLFFQRHVEEVVQLDRFPPLQNEMYWITTREGLTSRFRQLEIIHSNLIAHNRSLIVIDNDSKHYKDADGVSICKVFKMPATVKCVNTQVNDEFIRSHQCTLPPIESNIEKSRTVWLYKSSTYGLKSLKQFESAKSFQWSHTRCTLAYGFYLNLQNNSYIPIHFQPSYESLFNKSIHNLGLTNDNGIMKNLVVAHWRRGDQKDRCKRGEDRGINCGSVDQFIADVYQKYKYMLQLSASYQYSETSQLMLDNGTEYFLGHVYSHHDNILNRSSLTAAAAAAVSSTRERHPPRSKTPRIWSTDEMNIIGNISHKSPSSTLKDMIIYVSTNEKDPKILHALEKANFKLWKHIGLPKLNSLDTFIIELQLMISANVLLSWGNSGINYFTHRARKQRGISTSFTLKTTSSINKFIKM